MIRYTCVGPTVKDLKDKLQYLCDQGMGGDTIQTFDPDCMEWVEVTGFTYGGDDRLVKLYCDIDDDGDDEEGDDDIVPTIEEGNLMELEDEVNEKTS